MDAATELAADNSVTTLFFCELRPATVLAGPVTFGVDPPACDLSIGGTKFFCDILVELATDGIIFFSVLLSVAFSGRPSEDAADAPDLAATFLSFCPDALLASLPLISGRESCALPASAGPACEVSLGTGEFVDSDVGALATSRSFFEEILFGELFLSFFSRLFFFFLSLLDFFRDNVGFSGVVDMAVYAPRCSETLNCGKSKAKNHPPGNQEKNAKAPTSALQIIPRLPQFLSHYRNLISGVRTFNFGPKTSRFVENASSVYVPPVEIENPQSF